jgi:hypothetical protein
MVQNIFFVRRGNKMSYIKPKMKFVLYTEKYHGRMNTQIVPICESCLEGKHLSYGDDHRCEGSKSDDCKNLGEDNGTTYQCLCNPHGWSELYNAIEGSMKNKTLEVFDDYESAEKAKDDLEAKASK